MGKKIGPQIKMIFCKSFFTHKNHLQKKNVIMLFFSWRNQFEDILFFRFYTIGN